MRRLLLALAVVAVALPAGPLAAGGKKKTFKLTRPRPIAEGLRFTVEETMQRDLTVTGDGRVQRARFETDDHVVCNVQILAAEDDRVDRLSVEYPVVESRYLWDGEPGTMSTPHAGRSFTIEAGASGLVITGAGGEAVAASDVSRVLVDHGSLLRRTPYRKTFVGRTWRKGKKVKLGEEGFVDVFGDEQPTQVESFVLAFDGVDGDVAEFAFSAEYTIRDDGADVHVQLQGKLAVDVDRALERRLEYQGTVEITRTGETMTGTVSGVRTIEYRDQ